MATFSYTSLGEGDKYERGTIEARSLKQAEKLLINKGLLVINAKPLKVKKYSSLDNLLTSISRLDKIFFTAHLHTLLDAGISLDQAIKVTSEQTTNLKFKEILISIYQAVQKGQPLHTALLPHKKYFSDYYINLIKVGEASGKLDDVLMHLLEQQEREYELITKARGAMVYPAVIVAAMFVMVIFMMVFVIPQITDLLSQYGVDLPLATRILVWLSYILMNYGWLVIIIFIALFISLQQAFKKSIKVQHGWDNFLLWAPKLKTIVIEFNLAKLMRAMSATLHSGVSLDRSLSLAANISSNHKYQQVLQAGVTLVQKGVPLHEVLQGHAKLFPPITSRMIEVGERTGKLDTMLTRLAIFYEKSVVNTLNNLSSIIEPVLLIVIGLGVAFIAISILTPIWKFAETI